MAEGTTTGTEEAKGFPPFKTETFPSQFFWLAVTFVFLFVMLWKVAGPRIQGVIASRRGAINSDIAAAQRARGDAENAKWPASCATFTLSSHCEKGSISSAGTEPRAQPAQQAALAAPAAAQSAVCAHVALVPEGSARAAASSSA